MLKPSDTEQPRMKRQKAGEVLVLLGAAGYVIPNDVAEKVVDVDAEQKKLPVFSPVLFERLREDGSTNRRAEAVMLSILMLGNGFENTSLSVTAEAVRALRLVGLVGDAQALAREAVVSLLDHAE